MQLVDLIDRESEGIRWRVVGSAVIAGVANAAILAIINASSQRSPDQSGTDRGLFLFAIALAVYIICFRYTFREVSRTFEQMLHRIRLRISARIEQAEMSVLEGVGKSRIYNVLTHETLVISQSSGSLTFALQAALLVTFSALYILILSRQAFFLTIGLVAIGLFIYRQYGQQAVRLIHLATQKEIAFIDAVTHAIEGFKEVKLNQRRREDLFRELESISGELGRFRTETEDIYNKSSIFSQVFFYILIGAVVFLLPRIIPTYREVLTQVTTAILFVIGPLTALVGAIPAFSRANIAADNIFKLDRALESLEATEVPDGDRARYSRFSEIALQNAEFAFREADGSRGFTVGPVSFGVRRGEILFIVGGNGSGKSTLLRMLTGLYGPTDGAIRVDGEAITNQTIQSYRELFTAIFSDFHLFDKLYGLLGIEEERVNLLLTEMQLRGKTSFADDRFRTLDLSTGQRKRLALVVSLLEDKPVYVFDELAADQDPDFRRFLYHTLLPNLRERGKTIIAVTHDDHYFQVADRVIKMSYGKIEAEFAPKDSDTARPEPGALQ